MATKTQSTEQQTTVVQVVRNVTIPTHKVCARCKQDLPITEYYGKVPSSYCKSCSNQMHKEQRAKQAAEMREFREWRAAQSGK